MKKHAKGFFYTREKLEKAEELNMFGKNMYFRYWFLGKDIVAIQRVN